MMHGSGRCATRASQCAADHEQKRRALPGDVPGLGADVVAGQGGARHWRELATWPTLPALAFLVAAGSLAGFTIYMRLLRDWGAFRAGLYAFVSPVIAVGVGVVALSERFGWAEGLGAVLMFGAAAISLKRPPAAADEKLPLS